MEANGQETIGVRVCVCETSNVTAANAPAVLASSPMRVRHVAADRCGRSGLCLERAPPPLHWKDGRRLLCPHLPRKAPEAQNWNTFLRLTPSFSHAGPSPSSTGYKAKELQKDSSVGQTLNPSAVFAAHSFSISNPPSWLSNENDWRRLSRTS